MSQGYLLVRIHFQYTVFIKFPYVSYTISFKDIFLNNVKLI